ncbi:MAG TPA: metallophosphoesterase, partial [Limnochordia bacterium]|nr:metallophosphoesterase [Limnochordia bacterium]
MNFGGTLLAAAAIAGGWSFYEATRLDAHERALPDPRWPAAWRGARLVHLTDLHIRRWSSFERRVAAAVRAARPDLILITGDFLETADQKEALARF